ncbi:MAG: DUF2505 domain-containing protein [Stenotrophobium sp.]
MKFSYKQTFPAKADAVLGMFCNPAYHEKLQKALGAIDYKQLEHSDDGTRFRIKCAYQIKSDVPLPGFAKKILGETSSVTQEERWDRGSKTGEVIVQVKGLPATTRCATSLKDAGTGCSKNFDWDVSVKIPLVGGKIEQLIVGDIKKKNPIDEAATRKLLKEF